MNKSEKIGDIAAALALFQRDIKNPANSADNKFFSSKYAPLPEIINHIKAKLAEYQLSILQSVGGDGGNISVSTLVMHSSGEWIESDPLIIKNQEQKGVSLAQAAGISITYARRYSLSAALGISSEDDTDGNTGTQQKGTEQPQTSTKGNGNTSTQTGKKQTKKATQAQIDEVLKLANEKYPDINDFYKRLEEMESAGEVSTRYYATKNKGILWSSEDAKAVKTDLELPF